MKIRIGRNGYSLPGDLVTMTQAILARKRSGKSYTGAVQAEEMLDADAQVVIIDPTDAWWGLRAKADGEGEGYSIPVFGGDHADAPLAPYGGREMARAVVEHGFSAILCVANMHTDEQQTFVRDFCSELLRLNRSALHLFMDEADTYAPQKPLGKLGNECLGTVSRLVKQGGIRGIGFTMITQRPASINKDVLSQVDLLTILRMSSPHDLNPVEDWLQSETTKEFAKEVRAALPGLPVGTAFIASAPLGLAARVEIRQRRTFNSGATPKQGEKRIVPKLANVDAKKLGEEIAKSVQQAREDSPEGLRAKIQDLQRQLAEKGTGDVAGLSEHIAEMETELERLRPLEAELPGIRERISVLERDLEQAIIMKEEARNALEHFAREITAKAEELGIASVRFAEARLNGQRPPSPFLEMQPPAEPFEIRNHHVAPTTKPAPDRPEPIPLREPTLDGVRGKVLGALANFSAVGVHQLDRVLLAFFSGYGNARSKGFLNAIGGLRTAGVIEYHGDKVSLTADGSAIAPKTSPIHSNQVLHQRISIMLSPLEWRILSRLIDAYPGVINRATLAAAVGYENERSKGFLNAIGHLRTMGFIHYHSGAGVGATKLCFLNGRK